ncbi:hypothetical protein BKA70DRAFT_1308352 [Coprinopsis sp. MPI-PUGE-AT-0042]|nr:hypothetical protein BKA70DRAFT_1308352 [Coprinopsis sp. MPI-PUGE-AT-0042]
MPSGTALKRQRRCTLPQLQHILEQECSGGRFSMSSLDIFISFLDEEVANEMGASIIAMVPWANDPEFQQDYMYGMVALMGILRVVEIYSSRPATEQSQIRTKVQRNIIGILSWIFVCHHQPPKIPSTTSRGRPQIDRLFDMHPSIRMTLLNTPLALDVMLFFWDAVDENEHPFVTYDPYQKPKTTQEVTTTSCIILNLFTSFITLGQNLKASISLLQRIQEEKATNPSLWAESAVLRAKYVIRRLQEDPDQPLLAATTFLSALVWSTGTLFAMASYNGARAIMEVKVYEQYTSALHALSIREDCSSSPPQLLTECLLARQMDMIRFITSGQFNYVRAIAGMLQNGLLTNILRGLMTHSSPGDVFGKALSPLTLYSVYPTVLYEVVAAVNRVPPSICGTLSSGPLAPVWSGFQNTTQLYKDHLDALPRKPDMCDNLYHWEDNGKKRKFQGKICSRCHTFVYCSEKCQSRDWNLFHKRECPDSKHVYEWRKPYYRQYRISYRAFHQVLIRSLYQTKWRSVEAAIHNIRTTSAHNSHDVLALLNLATDNPNHDFTIRYLQNPTAVETDMRLKAIFERHFDDPESRLVEGSFIAGQDHACLMVALRLSGVEDGVPQYDIVNSYVRYYRPGS